MNLYDRTVAPLLEDEATAQPITEMMAMARRIYSLRDLQHALEDLATDCDRMVERRKSFRRSKCDADDEGHKTVIAAIRTAAKAAKKAASEHDDY